MAANEAALNTQSKAAVISTGRSSAGKAHYVLWLVNLVDKAPRQTTVNEAARHQVDMAVGRILLGPLSVRLISRDPWARPWTGSRLAMRPCQRVQWPHQPDALWPWAAGVGLVSRLLSLACGLRQQEEGSVQRLQGRG